MDRPAAHSPARHPRSSRTPSISRPDDGIDRSPTTWTPSSPRWASVVNRPKLGLVAVCSHCGRQNAADARFCSGCAAPLVREHAPPRAVRKVVTVLFCDLVESTPLGERLDPESLRRVMARWHEAMRTVLERHGGTVEKFVGDAVMAVFGFPLAYEDDALRAVRAGRPSVFRLGSERLRRAHRTAPRRQARPVPLPS